MELFRINLDVAAAKAGGLAGKISRLPALQARYKEIRDELAETCTQSFQSKAPVDTGELREEINWEPIDEPGLGYRAIISVQGEHLGRKGKSYPGGAGELAKFLDANAFRRSRKSLPEGPFNGSRSLTTDGWITEGRNAFLNIYRSLLRK